MGAFTVTSSIFVNTHRVIQDLLLEPHVEGIILRHAVPVIFGRVFAPGSLETWSAVNDNPSPTTVYVFRELLDALAPQKGVHPANHLSGRVPCEFSFLH